MPSANLRAKSARQSCIAKKVYAPGGQRRTLADARALVSTMDVTQGVNGLTYLLRRSSSGAILERIPVHPEALPLLAMLRGDA